MVDGRGPTPSTGTGTGDDEPPSAAARFALVPAGGSLPHQRRHGRLAQCAPESPKSMGGGSRARNSAGSKENWPDALSRSLQPGLAHGPSVGILRASADTPRSAQSAGKNSRSSGPWARPFWHAQAAAAQASAARRAGAHPRQKGSATGEPREQALPTSRGLSLQEAKGGLLRLLRDAKA